LGRMRPTADRRCWAGLAAACQAGLLGNGVRPNTARPAVGADAQSASSPRQRAWSTGNGGVTAGSPAAEVHRQDYAEHEHLHAHSPGTYTTAGSSRDDETSEADTAHRRRGGSTGYNASLASGTEGKRPEGCGIAASGGDWTRAQGLKLSPVTVVGEDRTAAGWRFRASPGGLAWHA
jgi:hypothetical protein